MDYKISAVKYYLNNNDDIRKSCKIFGCKKSSLHRWVKPENYKNYFYNAYKLKSDIKLQRKPSTRRRKQKQYKYT
tara:strand:+ start:346 stop:570 length:225 start_codon:yes stop_codon:yes gene_type:complete